MLREIASVGQGRWRAGRTGRRSRSRGAPGKKKNREAKKPDLHGQNVTPISAPRTSALGVRPVPPGRMTHWALGMT